MVVGCKNCKLRLRSYYLDTIEIRPIFSVVVSPPRSPCSGPCAKRGRTEMWGSSQKSVIRIALEFGVIASVS